MNHDVQQGGHDTITLISVNSIVLTVLMQRVETNRHGRNLKNDGEREREREREKIRINVSNVVLNTGETLSALRNR